MIKYNYVKQSEMKIDDDEGQLESVDAYDKITTLLNGFNRSCCKLDYTTNEWKYDHIRYLSEKSVWKHNILILACHFPELIKVLLGEVRTAIYWSQEIPYGVRDLMLHKAIA